MVGKNGITTCDETLHKILEVWAPTLENLALFLTLW
jgi:hypothetical protein